MKRKNFGWTVNSSADGFEQRHGRFTIEVFWNDDKRVWSWAIWAGARVNGRKDQTIIMSGRTPLLDAAKANGHNEAVKLERAAIAEDQKFR